MGKKGTDVKGAAGDVAQQAAPEDEHAGQGGSYVVDEAGKKTLVSRTDGERLRRKGPGLEQPTADSNQDLAPAEPAEKKE